MRIGKISPITKQYGDTIQTFDQQLARAGYSRAPGTAETLFPYREKSGRYRTGLDENAKYLERMSEDDKVAAKKRIKETKERLEKTLGVPGILDSNSPFYNFGASSEQLKARFGTDVQVAALRLSDKEEFFDDDDVMREIQWLWVSVHPRIAPSLDSYNRGEVPSDLKYYIVDDQAEILDQYNRKKEVNKATTAFEELNPSKKKQIARLMGLPVTEETKEELVYNLLDSALKDKEFKDGVNKGSSPIRLFNELLKMTSDRLRVKDLIEQAITHNIYRIGAGGKITEGGLTIQTSKADLVEFLLDDKNTIDLLALEEKLKNKKIAQ